VKRNGGPQKDARKTTCQTDVRKVQRDNYTIGQHADYWRAGPAGYSQSEQCDAGYACYWYCDSGKLRIQQQLSDERRKDQERQSRDGFGNSGEG